MFKGKPVVLAIDDEPRVLEVVRDLLEPEGFEVVFANNGDEALDILCSLVPSVILLDVSMPGMDGYTLCRQLNANPKLNETPVIFLTARASESEMARGFEAGAMDYVCKPFNRLQFRERIRSYVRMHDTLIAKRSRERRFEAVAAAANNAIIVIDDEAKVVFWNGAAQAIFGFTQDEVLGKALHPLVAPDEYQEAFIAGFEGFRKTGTGPAIGKTLELTGRKKCGDTFPIELSLSAFMLEEKWNAVGIVRDITERKRMEGLQERLVHKLQAAQVNLMNMARQAGKAEIATGILHNVGNIVNSVGVSTDLLVETVRKLQRACGLLRTQTNEMTASPAAGERGDHLDTLEKIGEYLAAVLKSLSEEADAVSKRVNQVKTIVSRQQSESKQGGALQVCALGELVEDALGVACPFPEQDAIEIVWDCDQSLQPMLLDRDKMVQILVNLITNAKHAVREGTAEERRIELRARSNAGNRVEVRVKDNGVGIAPHDISRLFTYGFTTRDAGHGFGLHSSALAASELEGSLRCNSEGLGQGAEFILEFPVSLAENSLAGDGKQDAGNRG